MAGHYLLATGEEVWWGDRSGGTISSVSATYVVIDNDDGSTTRLYGTGFAWDGTDLTAGTISHMVLYRSGTGNLEQVLGLSYDAATFSSQLNAAGDYSAIFADILSGNDNLIGGGYDHAYLYGLAGADSLTDNDGSVSTFPAGVDDILDGGAGDDLIYSYGGQDTIDGGADSDYANIVRAGGTAAETLDFTDPTVMQTFADGTTVVNVERIEVHTGSGADTITAATNSKVYTGDGDDTIHFVAGANNSYLYLDGGAGSDTLDFDNSANAVGVYSLQLSAYSSSWGGTIVGSSFERLLFTGGDASEFVTGGSLDDNLSGGGGSDTLIDGLTGTNGNDILDGGAGDDYLFAYGGIDSLDGGDDFDFADIDRSSGTVAETLDFTDPTVTQTFADGTTVVNVERIEVHTGSGADTITAIYNSKVYAGNGDDTVNFVAGSNDSNLYLDGQGGTDTLNFDNTANATGSYALDMTSTSSSWGGSIIASSFEHLAFTGGAAAESVAGGLLEDTMDGGGGNDSFFYSGGAADTIDGGDDDDFAYIDISGNTAAETLDFTDPTVTQTLANGTTIVNVERYEVHTGSGADTITAINNSRVYAGDGDDTVNFVAGSSSDSNLRLSGEGGSDTLDVDNTANTAGSYSLDLGSTSGSWGGSIYGNTFERLLFTGGDAVETVRGGLLDDVIDGGGGNDTLYDGQSGANGDDSLDGGAGDDNLYSYAGMDTLDGGADSDFAYIDRSGGTAAETLDFSDPTVTQTFADGTTVVNIERIEAHTGSGADTITDSVMGGTYQTGDGNDTITAGADATVNAGGDDDTVILLASAVDSSFNVNGGAGTDTLVLDTTLGTETYYRIALAGGSTPGWSGALNPTTFERLVYTGGAAFDRVEGGSLDDVLNGGDGNDYLYGNETYAGGDGGHDTIDGGGGNDQINDYDEIGAPAVIDDILSGGDGDDQITSYNGTDTIDGGADTDTVTIYRSMGTAGETLDFSDPSVLQTLADGTTIVNVENVQLYLGTGNHTITTGGASGTSNNVNTESGTDTLTGGDANDQFYSMEGNDVLDGGAGDDLLYGGDDNDMLTGGVGLDTLYGDAGDDILYSLDTDTRIDGGDGFDMAYFDRTGFAGNLTIDILSAGGQLGDGGYYVGLEQIEFTGGDGNDDLSGGLFADVLRGGDGRDALTGRAGADILLGGDGIDLLDGGDGDDIMDGGDGLDTLDGGDGNDDMYGGAGFDTMDGGAGDDNLDGGTGYDTMIGGTGNDTYVVDSVNDITFEVASEGIDTIRSSVDLTLVDEIENLILTGGAINGTGNTLDNVIEGNGLDNTLDGGDGSDTASYAGASSAVTVSLALQNSAQDTVGAGLDTLVNFENLSGSAHDDTLTGDEFANVISGGAGNDMIDGGDGGDAASYADATSRVVVDLRLLGVAQDTQGAGMDTLVGIENVIGSNYNDDLRGGTNGVNELHGGLGDDALRAKGNEGDALYGDDGADTLRGDAGNNLLDGGVGEDTIVGNQGNDEIHGGDDRDILVGSSGDDTIYGDGGDDELRGNTGSDTMYGGDGEDDLKGGSNNDFLYGGADRDILFGENANDLLDGGTGDDTMTGGIGADIFVYAIGYEFDRIRDFGDGNDRIDLSQIAGMTDLAAVEALMTETATGHVNINFGGGDILQVQNHVIADFDSGDFIFAVA